MLAAPTDLAPLSLPTVNAPFGDVLAHCPLCFTPGAATDPSCHYCGAEFDVGVMECAACGTHVAAAASRCPSCRASLV